jgi:hypothetical protein
MIWLVVRKIVSTAEKVKVGRWEGEKSINNLENKKLNAEMREAGRSTVNQTQKVGSSEVGKLINTQKLPNKKDSGISNIQSERRNMGISENPSSGQICKYRSLIHGIWLKGPPHYWFLSSWMPPGTILL